jgi:hypothetical protein
MLFGGYIRRMQQAKCRSHCIRHEFGTLLREIDRGWTTERSYEGAGLCRLS